MEGVKLPSGAFFKRSATGLFLSLYVIWPAYDWILQRWPPGQAVFEGTDLDWNGLVGAFCVGTLWSSFGPACHRLIRISVFMTLFIVGLFCTDVLRVTSDLVYGFFWLQTHPLDKDKNQTFIVSQIHYRHFISTLVVHKKLRPDQSCKSMADAAGCFVGIVDDSESPSIRITELMTDLYQVNLYY